MDVSWYPRRSLQLPLVLFVTLALVLGVQALTQISGAAVAAQTERLPDEAAAAPALHTRAQLDRERPEDAPRTIIGAIPGPVPPMDFSALHGEPCALRCAAAGSEPFAEIYIPAASSATAHRLSGRRAPRVRDLCPWSTSTRLGHPDGPASSPDSRRHVLCRRPDVRSCLGPCLRGRHGHRHRQRNPSGRRTRRRRRLLLDHAIRCRGRPCRRRRW